MNLLIGYADFIRLLNVKDPRTFIPGSEVRFDGVYVIPPAPSILLTPHERATLSEHPTSDLSKPALPFPCTWKELEDFIDREGLRHKYTFPQFFTYRETFIALQSRYPDLTEAELRMWVTGKKGLVALTDEPGGTRRSRLKHPAFRFHWDGSQHANQSIRDGSQHANQSIRYGSQHANQSINALLDCWFPSVQVLRFIPIQRYLTYEQLVERWKSRVSGDIHQFIADMVSAYRQQPYYRGFLEFGAFDPLGRLDLPVEDYVFAMDQVEEKEQRWFVQSVPRPEPQLRPFQSEDVRYFSRLPLWTQQEACYLVQNLVRIDASGHYYYNDFPVVYTWPAFANDSVQPPEADYIRVFFHYPFPVKPLEFIKFCEKRDIPLPSELVAKVKEMEGESALPEAANFIQEDTCQNAPLKRRDEQWKYLENEIKTRGWNPMKIPLRGKKELREYCVNNMRTLFLSEDAFDKFWQDMRRQSRINN